MAAVDVKGLMLKQPDVELLISPTLPCESKNPPLGFSDIFPNGWEFLNKFLHTYYTFLSTLDYKFIFSYLQL